MKICINTLSVDSSKGGIRYFLLGLLSELIIRHPKHTYYLIVCKNNIELFERFESIKNVKFLTTKSNPKGALSRIICDQTEIPKLASDCDLIITPSNIATLFTRKPQIVVIQAPLAVRSIRNLCYVPKNLISTFHKLYYYIGLKLTMRRARHVVAVSNFLCKHLESSYPKHINKVTVIHEGVSFKVQPRPEDYAANKTLLFVSSLFPYKNADKLLETFSIITKTYPHLRDFELILCGKDPDGLQLTHLKSLAVNLGIDKHVTFLGHVSHEKLGELYASCRAFVYPSSVETFGLPLLEAMAFGAPVICSDKMSVPEVAGNAAIVIDPTNTKDFSEAILRIIENPNTADFLSKRGYVRVAEFSWIKCAQQFNELIEDTSTH